MKLITTVLIIVLFSGISSAQNTNNNLPVSGNNSLLDASLTLRTLNQTTVPEKLIAESAATDIEIVNPAENVSLSGFSKRADVNQQNKISELKEKMSLPETKQKISYCNLGACDIETSNTGFWVFISAVAFAVGSLIGKGN